MPSTTGDTMPRTVLVTGAAGLIGVSLVRCLRAQGFRVVAVDDGSAKTLHRLGEFANCADIIVRVLDIRHRAELIRLMAAERPWGVVHLAARHFIPDCDETPTETLDVNVVGTQHVVDACTVHSPHRLVFASTADVYATSHSPHDEDNPVGPPGVYGWSKLLSEWLLRGQAHRLGNCDVVIARLFNVYGPGDPHPHLLPEVLRQAQRSRILHLGDLDAARDFVYVDDVTDALVILLRIAAPGVFNISSGTPMTGRDLVDIVATVTGRHLETRVDPARLRRTSRSVSYAIPNRLREVVPWWPRTPLPEGVRRTIAADFRPGVDKPEGKVS